MDQLIVLLAGLAIVSGALWQNKTEGYEAFKIPGFIVFFVCITSIIVIMM